MFRERTIWCFNNLCPIPLFECNKICLIQSYLISDPQISSQRQNGIIDLKGLENKIYTMMKGMGAFYSDHTVPITSCSEVQYVL